MLYATRIAYPKSQTERGYPTAQTLNPQALVCFSLFAETLWNCHSDCRQGG